MNTKRLSPELSIIVPIYGVEKYLCQCLDSIAAQTFKDFECILVDDGSKDGCPTICDEYAAKDSRFKVIHKNNAGYGAAVNTGFDLAKGEWIGIVEPDDWIESDMYEKLITTAEASGADVTKSGFDSFYDGGKKAWAMCLDTKNAGPVFKLNDIPHLLNNHPSIWACVYRRDFLALNGIRLEESEGATWQDNLFQVQSLVLARSIAYVPQSLYHYRLFDNKPLKDVMMPLRRSLQIRQWINGVGYIEDEISAALLKRELNYVAISVSVAKHHELHGISTLAYQLFSLVSFGKSIPPHLLKKRERFLLWLCKGTPFLCIILIKLDLIHKMGHLLRALHLRKR